LRRELLQKLMIHFFLKSEIEYDGRLQINCAWAIKPNRNPLSGKSWDSSKFKETSKAVVAFTILEYKID